MRTSRQLILLITAMLFTGFSFSQVIHGSVKDRTSGEPLIGATVLIKGSFKGITTDVNGNFVLPVETLPVILAASFISYKEEEIVVNDTLTQIHFRLSPLQTTLKEVNITDSRLTEKQRQSPLTVEAMDIIAIKETPAANFYEGLGQLKGVDLTSASIGFKVINTRGFNSTSPVRSLQIIDGIDNQSPGLNFSLGNFLGSSEMDVLKVDLIAGASSAFYGPNAFNGVISITTRSPFIKPGFEISAKTGTRNLLETAMRYAVVFKNKKGSEKLGIKFNAFFMKARDWEAHNLSPTPQSLNDESNPGGYDAVNIYGDEYNSLGDQSKLPTAYPGLGTFYRKGYAEKDLVDYNTQNIKLGAAFHYKVKPENEIIYSSSFGYGTTIYQGDNRFSLKDISFYQNRLEYRKDNKFFVRVYETHENAGKSYDAYFTALLLQRKAKSDIEWFTDYRNYWASNYQALLYTFPGFPVPANYPDYTSYLNAINPFLVSNYYDSLLKYHQMAGNYAAGDGSPFTKNDPYYVPGTIQFDTSFASITSKESFNEGGSKFFDKSALYHAHAEYIFNASFADITTGASYRMYRPYSRGTIFSDTSYYEVDTVFNTDQSIIRIDSTFRRKEITNQEGGLYIGLERKFYDDMLKLNATVRADKNENFPLLVSPALSAVATPLANHTVRLTFSSAIRNPTLTDQYLYYPVGRAILIGNINGYEHLATPESFVNFLNTQNYDTLEYFNIDAVVPEKVRTIEAGYRTTLFNKLYLDANYYYSFYEDFIGYRIAVDVDTFTINTPFGSSKQFILNNFLRIASNASEQVTTSGFSIGLNYFFAKYYSLSGNYSFNQLNKVATDPLIPAFNTPRHKFNIGFAGRDILTERIRNWGFNINYKWIEGFIFEGSPQFTGRIGTYDLVDLQINKKFPVQKTTFKFGVQNLLNNKHYEVYGGPLVGRLAYMQVLVELN